MSSVHVDRENQSATTRMQNAHSAKMAGMGTATPSTVQRKPLGEVNRMDPKHQGNTKEPVRAKSSSVKVTAAVNIKSRTQQRQTPISQLHHGTKHTPVERQQVKENSDMLAREMFSEAQHLSDVDDDSDIECMFPAPDEDDFSNWFPADEKNLAYWLKSWKPPVSQRTSCASPLPSPPQFAPMVFDETGVYEKPVQLPDISELPPLDDEPDLEYFSSLH